MGDFARTIGMEAPAPVAHLKGDESTPRIRRGWYLGRLLPELPQTAMDGWRFVGRVPLPTHFEEQADSRRSRNSFDRTNAKKSESSNGVASFPKRNRMSGASGSPAGSSFDSAPRKTTSPVPCPDVVTLTRTNPRIILAGGEWVRMLGDGSVRPNTR